MDKLVCNILGFGFLFLPGTLSAAECMPFRSHDLFTNDFFFAASSAAGAVGDVVAVDITLTSENPRADLEGFGLVGCYDGDRAELLGDPLYSEEFDGMVLFSNFYRVGRGDGPPLIRGADRTGFALGAGVFKDEIVVGHFPSNVPFPIMTLFFRLKGQPGDAPEIQFCDDIFQLNTAGCFRNTLSYLPKDSLNPLARAEPLRAHSTRHVSGQIRILPGPATNTEPPVLPPNAKVYPEAPRPEATNITFELTGASVVAGAVEVPLEVYITSNYEFSGFSVALEFPSRYLQLVKVEERTRPGVVKVNNDMGTLGMAMFNSRRRVGAESERAHIATLYFNVKPEAKEVAEIPLRFDEVPFFTNWIAINYLQGLNSNPLAVSGQVSPLTVFGSVLEVRDSRRTPRGDATFDGQFDLSDPISVISFLFLGGPAPGCVPAADFNLDGALNLADPIAMLGHLFLGEAAAGGEDPPQAVCR